jgi:uncharacterized membrane protein required for colicin V production
MRTECNFAFVDGEGEGTDAFWTYISRVHWVDILLILWLLRACIRGFRRGLIATLIGAVSWLLALLLAVFSAQPAAAWLEAQYGWASSIGSAIAKTIHLTPLLSGIPVNERTIFMLQDVAKEIGLPPPLNSLIVGYAGQIVQVTATTSNLTWNELMSHAMGFLIFDTVCFVFIFVVSGFLLGVLGGILGSGLKHLIGPGIDRLSGLFINAIVYAAIASVILSFLLTVGSVPLLSGFKEAIQASRLGLRLAEIGLSLSPFLAFAHIGPGRLP